jgi:hypothetical protein
MRGFLFNSIFIYKLVVMKKNILNEINQMKYLFDYKKGVVISEQKIILNEGKIEDIYDDLPIIEIEEILTSEVVAEDT